MSTLQQRVEEALTNMPLEDRIEVAVHLMSNEQLMVVAAAVVKHAREVIEVAKDLFTEHQRKEFDIRVAAIPIGRSHA